jgi:hypothetical protein
MTLAPEREPLEFETFAHRPVHGRCADGTAG